MQAYGKVRVNKTTIVSGNGELLINGLPGSHEEFTALCLTVTVVEYPNPLLHNDWLPEAEADTDYSFVIKEEQEDFNLRTAEDFNNFI